MKTVLHLLASGDTGGIEILCRDYAVYSKHNNIFAILWSPGIISDGMKYRGDTIIELGIQKKEYFKAIKKLCKIMYQYKVDVIIAHHASPLLHIFLMILKFRFRSITTITYAHGLAEVMFRVHEKHGAIFRKIVLQSSLKRADCVVAVSYAVKNSLVQTFKIPESKIQVIYNGVDTERFFVREKNVTSKTLKLIYVGRLIKDKGVQTILQALALGRDEKDFHLSIVGDGVYREELQKLVKELGIEQKVEFLGNRNDVPELLSEAKVFLHVPLLEEGFGITVIEAMACGLICICSRSGALPEIISDKVNGFLVDKGDIKGICNVINFVYKMSDSEKKEIRVNAIKRALDFSSDRFGNGLDELIENFSKMGKYKKQE